MEKRFVGPPALALAVLLLIPACSGLKGPPDPAKVQRKMAATLEGESELIRSTVASPERAGRLVALLGERDRWVAEQAEAVHRYRQRMEALNADYHAGRESFEEAVATYNEERSAVQRGLAGVIEAMKEETTAEEWKKIAKYQLKKLNPRELAYEQAGEGG